jgi:carbamoyltransferase
VIVLGLIDSKPSSVAVLADGRVLGAVAEERLCRKKMATGFPRMAVREALRVSGVEPREVDRVAVAQKVSVFQSEPVAWEGWFADSNPLQPTWLERVASQVAPTVGRFPLAWEAHHRLKALTSRERVREIPRILREEYGVRAPVTFYDHHYCHATTAYYTSGLAEALVLTLDGGGDGLSGTVYLGRGGQLERLGTVDSFNSLGNFYSYVTALCGFRAEKDEGKITGLAATGRPVYADALRRFIHVDERGQIRYRVAMYHAGAVARVRQALPDGFDPADLAASVQLVLEEVGTAFVRYWARRTGLRHVAVAGGVFANVKFNQRVHELDEVDELFIHPGMDDSGLSLGSALAATLEHRGDLAPTLVERLRDVYFGPEATERDIQRAIDAAGVAARREPHIHRAVAERLAAGDVVARCHGRMEYGPRALGHRSILYQTGDPSVNDWLNQQLKRTEFMPFAPATLVEHADSRYRMLEGVRDTARFMTVTVDCTPEMAAESPGVVHFDGTARPQLVDRDTAPDFHAILTEFHRRTGVPSLVNTSFNMHEEPIVCTAEDALRAFQSSGLDWLALGDYLIDGRGRGAKERGEAGSVASETSTAP